MLEQCDFMELTEEVLQQYKGFTCKDEDITEFFTQDYADYAYQLLGKSYCFVKPDTSEIVCAFTVANSSVKVDSLPSNLRNKLNRKIPNAKRRPQYHCFCIKCFKFSSPAMRSSSSLTICLTSSFI